MDNIMSSSDVLTVVLALVWNLLIRTEKRNYLYRLYYTSLAALTTYASKTLPEFAPGLLDAIKSDSAPGLTFWKSLPDLPVHDGRRAMGVYVLVLEKDGYLPGIYIGSGTCAREGFGVRSRMMQYNHWKTNRQLMPLHVLQYLEDGFKITHKGLLCWHRNPTESDSRFATLLMLALEATFAYYFWANNFVNSPLTTFCGWPTDDLPYVGLCSHSALYEPVDGDFDLTTEQQREQDRIRRENFRESDREHRRARYATDDDWRQKQVLRHRKIRKEVQADPVRHEHQLAHRRRYQKQPTEMEKIRKRQKKYRSREDIRKKVNASNRAYSRKPENKAKAKARKAAMSDEYRAALNARQAELKKYRQAGIKPPDFGKRIKPTNEPGRAGWSVNPATGVLPVNLKAAREPTPDLLDSTATDPELSEDELELGDLDLPRPRQVTRRRPTYILPESDTDTDTDTDTDLPDATELGDLDLPSRVPKFTETNLDAAMSEEFQGFMDIGAYDAPTQNASQAVEIVDLSAYDTTAVPPRRAGAPVLHDREVSDSEEDSIMGDLADETSTNDNTTGAFDLSTFGTTAVLPRRASVLQNHEIIEISDGEDCIMSDMADDEITGDLQEVYDYLDHSSDEDYLAGDSSDSDGE